ncbi:hypothetical protein HKD37_03G008911 [Glycine soja]
MEEYEGEENNGALTHSHLPNTSLAELNMLLVLLSLFYFSSDECIEYHEESQEKTKKDEVAVTKTCIARLQSKRREKHEPKLGRKPISSRFQTTAWKKNVKQNLATAEYCTNQHKDCGDMMKQAKAKHLF